MIIFFHRHPNGRCWSCGRRPNWSCGYHRSFRLNGFRRYNCCHGLSLTRNFSATSCCFCCSCHSTSWVCCLTSWACYSCRCCSNLPMKDATRKNPAGAHTRSWSVRDGCCWAKYSFGVDCFGCSCWHCCLTDGFPTRYRRGCWHSLTDGCSSWDGCLWKVC